MAKIQIHDETGNIDCPSCGCKIVIEKSGNYFAVIPEDETPDSEGADKDDEAIPEKSEPFLGFIDLD